MTFVYVGTYTSDIHVYQLDSASGRAQSCSHAGTACRNRRICVWPLAGRTLYATNELVDDGWRKCVSPSTRPTGELRFLNRVASGGADPAHLSVEPTGGWLLVANYTGGTIAVLPITSDGGLREAERLSCGILAVAPHPRRQRGPHPHMIVTDPAGVFVLVPDLGVDAVLAYRLEAGRLIAQPDRGRSSARRCGPTPPGLRL